MKKVKSPLERVVEALTGSDVNEIEVQLLVENPFVEGGWASVAKRAVEVLEEPGEIREFMGQYAAFIQGKYNIQDPTEAERIAKNAIGYCTGYADERKANLWFEALPDISHPIMGREKPFLKGKEFTGYYLVGESDDQGVREYLREKAGEALSPYYHVELVEGRGNRSYFALQIEGVEGGLFREDYQTVLFLHGIARGLSGRMEEDIGKACKLTVETTEPVR